MLGTEGKKMKKRENRLIYNIVVSVILLFFCTLAHMSVSKAAKASVDVSSTGTAEVGDDVSVSLSISGDSISAYTVYVTYDSSVLTFNSGSGAIVNDSGGTIIVSGTSAGAVSLSFTAANAGNSNIATSGEFYDIDMNELKTSYGSSYVEVEKEKTTEATTQKPNEPEEPEKPEKPGNTKSSNCNLYTLEVSEGTLEPEFNASTTYYEMHVARDVTYIEVSAYPADNKASVSVSDNDNIEPGENTTYVTVTAENGDTKVYTIRVIAGETASDSRVTVNGINYSFLGSFSEIYDYMDIPDGYEEVTITYDTWDVPAFMYNDGKAYIVYLKDGQGNVSPFVYDKDNSKFYRYVFYRMNDNRYLITDMHEDIKLGDAFKETTLSIEGEQIKAYKSDDLDENCYIIYAINLDGDSGIYIYDSVEGNMMRYTVITDPEDSTPSDATATDATTEAPQQILTEEIVTTENNQLTTKKDKEEGVLTKNQFKIMLIVVGVVFFILILLIIVFAFRFKALRAQGTGDSNSDDFVDELWKLDDEEDADSMDEAAATEEDVETQEDVETETAEDEEASDIEEMAEAEETKDEQASDVSIAEDEKTLDAEEAEAVETSDVSETKDEETSDAPKAEDGKVTDVSKAEDTEAPKKEDSDKEEVEKTKVADRAHSAMDELNKKLDMLAEANGVLWAEELLKEKQSGKTEAMSEEEETKEKPKKKKSSFDLFDAE